MQKSSRRVGSHSSDGGSINRRWPALTRTAVFINTRVKLSMTVVSLLSHSQLSSAQALKQGSQQKHSGMDEGEGLEVGQLSL